jgi:predicted flap endonuclease-1-like 5' DNA nuclease
MTKPSPDNDRVADILERVADLLEITGDNPFRVRSYRNAARAVNEHKLAVAGMVNMGKVEDLKEIPGIGSKLAGAIVEIVVTGRLGLLDRLEGEVTPEQVLRRVPGIGPKLAGRIHKRLGVESLEDLEIAAHDGSLSELEGVGEKKVEGVKDALAGMLNRSAGRRSMQRRRKSSKTDRPPVRLLLEIDREYRTKAGRGQLKKIAPRRFNPEGKTWLPIMNTRRDGWRFTALYSNTSRAHELDKIHDWVVIYYEKAGEERQVTVITAQRGPLEGRRVVRGRERETREYYDTDS